MQLDVWLCLRLSRAAHIQWLRMLFRAVSRLGDGVFWYALMFLLLAADGTAAIAPVLHMVAAGLAGTILYRWLKAKTLRPRPYQVNQAISCNARPLDQFSFPSGHTLHAFAFTTREHADFLLLVGAHEVERRNIAASVDLALAEFKILCTL